MGFEPFRGKCRQTIKQAHAAGQAKQPAHCIILLHTATHQPHWLIHTLQTHRQTHPVSGVDEHPCGVPSSAPRPCTTTKPLLDARTPKPLSSVALTTLALHDTLPNPESAASLCRLTNVPNKHTAWPAQLPPAAPSKAARAPAAAPPPMLDSPSARVRCLICGMDSARWCVCQLCKLCRRSASEPVQDAIQTEAGTAKLVGEKSLTRVAQRPLERRQRGNATTSVCSSLKAASPHPRLPRDSTLTGTEA